MRAQRDWPALEPLLFGAALAAYAAGLPFGLERTASAAAVGDGIALTGGDAPLALLAVRLLGCLPLGDLATRANLASAITGAMAVALLGRLACEALRALRPAPHARQAPFTVEPIAAAGAAGVAALSLGAFRAATAGGSGPVTVAIAAAAWVCVLALVRAPEDARAGMRLALLAGLAAGVEPLAAALVWTPALVLWLWALRRGTRWPLVAPLLFVAGLGVALFAVAISDAPLTLAQVVPRLWPTTGSAAPAATRLAFLAGPAVEAGEQLGVVGLLLGALGLLVLGGRRPLTFVFVLSIMAAALWLPSGAPLAAAAAVAPLAVGIAHLADKLGRARLAAATAIAVMAVVSPALDGGTARWARDVRLPARLLARALADVPLRATVDPGTPEMSGLFHYAESLGLRPDITVTRR